MKLPADALFKVLGPDGESIHGGTATWSLPNGKPGAWMPTIADPACCHRGYHLVALAALPEWVRLRSTLYLAEGRGASDTDGSGKTAFAEARLRRPLSFSLADVVAWSADCAERVLPHFEAVRPGDDRPAKAIEAARTGPAGGAAWAAEYAAAAAEATAGPAEYAAGAAGGAARAAERQWQTERLAHYIHPVRRTTITTPTKENP